MRRFVIAIFALLTACGGEYIESPDNHGYGFDYDLQGTSGLKLRYTPVISDPNIGVQLMALYEEAVQQVHTCTSLQAPPPFIAITQPHTLAPAGAMYLMHPTLILVDGSAYRYPSFVKHEMVHYLLDVNTGDPDPHHTSRFFGECA